MNSDRPSSEGSLISREFFFRTQLSARVVKVRKAADGLIAFAKREGITHVIFGQSARNRWHILLQGSVLSRFLDEVKGAAVQIIPPSDGPEKQE